MCIEHVMTKHFNIKYLSSSTVFLRFEFDHLTKQATMKQLYLNYILFKKI